MSKSAITFQLDITLNYYAMFYKYILYKIKVVTNQDLMYNANNILSPPSIKDENVSLTFVFCNYFYLSFLMNYRFGE